MNLELINSIACGLISLWATWCVLSGKVRDGILGKLIYTAISISGFVVMARSQNIFFGPTTDCRAIFRHDLAHSKTWRGLLAQALYFAGCLVTVQAVLAVQRPAEPDLHPLPVCVT